MGSGGAWFVNGDIAGAAVDVDGVVDDDSKGDGSTSVANTEGAGVDCGVSA